MLPKPLGINGRYTSVIPTGLHIEVPGPSAPARSRAGFAPLPASTIEAKHFVDQFTFTAAEGAIWLSGWAVPLGNPLFEHEVRVALVADDGLARTLPTERIGRPDVRAVMGRTWAHNSGFALRAILDDLPGGRYDIALVLVPLPWAAGLRRARQVLANDSSVLASTRRLAMTRADLDLELKLMQEAQAEGVGPWMAYGASFALYEDVASLPTDPYSDEYRESQLKLYKELSGAASYDPWLTEPIPISEPDEPVESFAYPFRTRAAEHIGNHYVAVGHILRAMGSVVPAGGKILEYGPGEGFTTMAMASSGFRVSAVDINAQALHIVDLLAANRSVGVSTLVGEFGAVPGDEAPYDAVLFYESFHHCLDFVQLLQRMEEVLTPTGVIVFAGEPVTDDFPKPWGLRLDGGALWEICNNGWLELGFSSAFFEELLRRQGWTMEIRRAPGSPDIRIARRSPAP